MSLYPGAPRLKDSQYVLDDLALQDSLAKAIEDAMVEVYPLVKGAPLPETGKDDRRLLFVAIARGILKYLKGKEAQLISSVQISHTSGTSEPHAVSNLNLNIQMNK